MSLRLKFILYLSAIHLLFGSLAVYLLVRNRLWLLVVEIVFAVSFTTGLKIIRGMFGTLDLIRSGAQLLDERDFTSRFREVGHPEMDHLVHIYNRMADHLREERARLQEQHYLMDSILRVSPSGIITLDFDTRIALANPAAERMLQAATSRLVGRHLSELGTPFSLALADLPAGESQVIPLWGSRRVKCSRVEFRDRGFSRCFISMEELTEELHRTEKAAYGKLIRIMSHEVNNSTGAVSSLLHSCLNYGDQLRPADRSDFQGAMEVAIARTHQLNSFMSSFADVVRLPLPQKSDCDVRRLLEELTVLMKGRAGEQNISWNWAIEEPIGAVRMDRAQMGQVFVNILKNSMDAIEGAGTITLRLGKLDGRKYLAVEDSGIGLSGEAEANLFVPFFSTKTNGQGIGLTVVKEILTRHQFDYSLESRSGGPTKFSIFF